MLLARVCQDHLNLCRGDHQLPLPHGGAEVEYGAEINSVAVSTDDKVDAIGILGNEEVEILTDVIKEESLDLAVLARIVGGKDYIIYI